MGADSLADALKAYKELLMRANAQLEVTVSSGDGKPLQELRSRCGGTFEGVPPNCRWVLKGEDAAALIATAYALSGVLQHRKDPRYWLSTIVKEAGSE